MVLDWVPNWGIGNLIPVSPLRVPPPPLAAVWAYCSVFVDVLNCTRLLESDGKFVDVAGLANDAMRLYLDGELRGAIYSNQLAKPSHELQSPRK